MNQLAITGTAVPRRRGAAVRQLEVTLRAWRAAGHLEGPDNAAARSALRDAAEAVDAARTAMRAAQHDDRAPRTLAECARALSSCSSSFESMRASLAPREGADDALDAFLAQLGTPALSDTPDA
jgi:hypothetical protein